MNLPEFCAQLLERTSASARWSAPETRTLPRRVPAALSVLVAIGLQHVSAGEATEPVIGEGVISTPHDEFGGSLSPDGKTIYFDRSVPAHYLYTMWESHLVGDKWQAPALMSISGYYRDSDPVLSPDGKKLLFVSDRPVNGIDRHHYEIWICHRQGE